MAKKTDVEVVIKANADDAEDTLDDLKKKGDDVFIKKIPKAVDKGNKEVKDSFKKLGIVTKESVKKANKDIKESYLKIKKSGTSSANDIKRAHIAMTKQIQANNKKIKIASGNIFGKGLSKSISGARAGINSLGSVASSLAVKFGILSTAALAVGTAFGVKAFKESAKFETSLLDLQKVLSDTEGDAKDFTDQIDELSLKYGIAAEDILEGVTGFKQAGFTIKESFDLQTEAIKLGIAGNLEMAESQRLITQTLKGFKKPAEEATRLVDVLNEVSNNYATDVTQLAEGMATLSPIAAKMGLTFEETAGLLTPVIEVFGSGTEAAVSLKTGLLKLIDDAKPVQDALEGIGVAQRDSNGKLRDGKDILRDVSKAFRNIDQSQKLFLTTQLVGLEQAGRMVEVFDGLEKSVNITDVALGAAGSAAKEVAVRLSSSELQVNRSKIAFNRFARSIGDTFKNEMTGVIESITDVELSLANIADEGGFEPLLKLIRPQLEEWKKIFEAIAEGLPESFENIDFSGVFESFDGLKEVIANTFTTEDITTVAGITAVIQKLVNALEFFIKVGKFGVDAFNLVRKAILGLELAFQSAALGIVKAGEIITGVLNKIGLAKGLNTIFKLAGQDLSKQVQSTSSNIQSFKDGGLVGGKAGVDQNLARVSKDEFVLKPSAVQNIGIANAKAINNLQKPDLGGSSTGSTVNVNLDVGGRKVALSGKSNEVDKLVKEIKNLNIKKGRYESRY